MFFMLFRGSLWLPFFCLPSVAGKPVLLQEAGVTPIKGKQSESQGRIR
jgi:hypothetical protein